MCPLQSDGGRLGNEQEIWCVDMKTLFEFNRKIHAVNWDTTFTSVCNFALLPFVNLLSLELPCAIVEYVREIVAYNKWLTDSLWVCASLWLRKACSWCKFACIVEMHLCRRAKCVIFMDHGNKNILIELNWNAFYFNVIKCVAKGAGKNEITSSNLMCKIDTYRFSHS